METPKTTRSWSVRGSFMLKEDLIEEVTFKPSCEWQERFGMSGDSHVKLGTCSSRGSSSESRRQGSGGVWGWIPAKPSNFCFTWHHGATQDFYEEESDRLEFSVRENRNLVWEGREWDGQEQERKFTILSRQFWWVRTLTSLLVSVRRTPVHFFFFPPERVCTNATPILNNTNLNNFKWC